jgi:hypothetical protein
MNAEQGHEHAHAHVHVPARGYETRDVSVAPLLKFGGGLIVALVATVLLMLGFYHLFVSRRPAAVEEKAQANIYQQLRDLHRDEDAALGRYGWVVDRKAGIVRIPIDRAMDLVAEKPDRFGKGPKTELEMNSHAGTPVPPASASTNADATSTASPGPKP